MSIVCQKKYALTVTTANFLYWKFDVVTSGNYLDAVQSVPIPQTTTSLVPGIISNGVTMTTVGGAFLTPIDTGLISQLGILGTDSSFSFWFKVNSFGASVQPLEFGFNWTGADPNPAFFVKMAPPGFFAYTIRLTIACDSNNLVYDGAPTGVGVWHFVAMTCDALGNAKIYIDNSLVSSASNGPSAGGPKGQVVGIYQNALGAAPDVVFDEVGAWPQHVLSVSEISQMWNGGAGARPPGVP